MDTYILVYTTVRTGMYEDAKVYSLLLRRRTYSSSSRVGRDKAKGWYLCTFNSIYSENKVASGGGEPWPPGRAPYL
jgi:hypothetical protein